MELTQEEKMMVAAKQQMLLRRLIDESNKNKFYVVDADTGENRGSVVIDPYDDWTEEDYDNTAQEAYDNLVHSLIEAGGEIRFLRELLTRAYEQLLLIGYDSSFTNEEIYKLVNEIKEYLEEIK